MNKKMSWCVATVLALAGLADKAWAAASDDVALSVTLSNAVSVYLPTATYDFGPVSLSGQSVSTTPIEVDNDSGGIREDYSLSMVDSVGGWTAVTTTPGTDEYAVQVVFVSTQPSHGDFGATDYLAGGAAPVAASASVFAPDAAPAAQKGFDVTDTSGTHERSLWLRLQMPSSVTTTQSNPFATIWVSAAAG
jgi:hypothetical protein